MSSFRFHVRAHVLVPCALAVAAAAVLLACSGTQGEDTGETSEAYTKDCPPAVVEGIDVYDGQGTINWTKVKDGPGPDGGGLGDGGLMEDGGTAKAFAFIKATQGNYNQQTKFAENWTNAKAAGVLRSAYHFFDPSIDGKEQAAYFLAQVGSDIGELPPMLDIECPTDAVKANASANCEYTGHSGWAPPATIASRIFDFLDAVEAATGKKAILYSYPSWFATVQVTDAKLADYPLYIASLNDCASVPAPWTTATFWQWSFTGTVYGINGQVDLDRFMGDENQLNVFAFGVPDAGVDAAPPPVVDAGNFVDSGAPAISVQASAEADGGCGCKAAGRTPSSGGPLVLAAGIAVALLRRRRRRAPSK